MKRSGHPSDPFQARVDGGNSPPGWRDDFPCIHVELSSDVDTIAQAAFSRTPHLPVTIHAFAANVTDSALPPHV